MQKVYTYTKRADFFSSFDDIWSKITRYYQEMFDQKFN